MSGYRVPAVVAAARVLRELETTGHEGATLSELSRRTGRSKSTMHNLLATLEDERLVHRADGSRRFRLGTALIPLGLAAQRQTSAVAVAAERLGPMASDTGLSFAVAQHTSDDRAQVVQAVTPPSGVHVGISVGDRFGPFDGALGKCLLAAAPAESARAQIAGALVPRHTFRTLTDPEALLAEVGETRRTGWALSRGELNDNNAVAATVHGPDGRPVAHVVALGFPTQLTEEAMPRIGRELAALARAVTDETGGRPPGADDGSPRSPVAATPRGERA
jgi:IclR family acetate operon transcriptional repressor